MSSCGSAEVGVDLYERCSVRHVSVFKHYVWRLHVSSVESEAEISSPSLGAGQLPNVKQDQAFKALQHTNLLAFCKNDVSEAWDLIVFEQKRSDWNTTAYGSEIYVKIETLSLKL